MFDIRKILLSILSVVYVLSGLFLMIFDIYFSVLILIGASNFVSLFRKKPNKLTLILYGSQTVLISVFFILIFVGNSIYEMIISIIIILLLIIAFGYLFSKEYKLYKS